MHKQPQPQPQTSLLFRNDEWAAELIKQGRLIAGTSVFTSNRGNTDINSYVTSPTVDLIFNEITINENFRGAGELHRRKAVGSIILSVMAGCNGSSNEDTYGFLYRTTESQTAIKRYENRSFNIKARTPAIKHLKDHGYIEHYKGGNCFFNSCGERLQLKTLLIPTAKLIDACRKIQMEAHEIHLDTTDELVRLHAPKLPVKTGKKGRKKSKAQLKDYEDNFLTISSRNTLKARNTINMQYQWEYRNDMDESLVIPSNAIKMHRMFLEGSFEVYGRVHYAAQHIKSQHRRTLTIDGEDTIELDFSAMQPTIAYAQLKLTPPSDLYKVEGFTREQTKSALLIAFNCKNKLEAAHSLNTEKKVKGELQKRKTVDSLEKAYALLEALEELHQPINQFFYSQAWKRLSFSESEIIMAIIGRLNELQIPAITIHDSVIVKDSAKFVAYGVMRNVFIRMTGVEPIIKTE